MILSSQAFALDPSNLVRIVAGCAVTRNRSHSTFLIKDGLYCYLSITVAVFGFLNVILCKSFSTNIRKTLRLPY